MFESAAHGGPLGRYDILFAYPQAAVWKDQTGHLHGHLYGDIGHSPTPDSFLSVLDAWVTAERSEPSATPLPFTGGWLLFLSYEMAREVEPRLNLPAGTQSIVALALRIPAAILFDHKQRQAHLVAERAELLHDLAQDALATAPGGHTDNCGVEALEEEEAQRFLQNVRQAQDYIRAGDIYQANLSRLWRASLTPESTATGIYRRLRSSNPAPFAASCVWKDFAILSSSPERLCELRHGEISTRPIAGTRPRSREPGADAEETSKLIAHPKERAEHIMLIDLERNDLGRVCVPGSVRVDEFMIPESYEHVHHIVSNVRGRLREGVTPGEVLRAVFPGGTITGCPKVRCMQIIAELEAVGRGAYTGTLGYLNRDGTGDFNILIRTLVMQGRELTFRAGAGIVADSDPERELEETRAKAKGLLRALQS